MTLNHPRSKSQDFALDISKNVSHSVKLNTDQRVNCYGLLFGIMNFDVGWPWTVLNLGHRIFTSDLLKMARHNVVLKNIKNKLYFQGKAESNSVLCLSFG